FLPYILIFLLVFAFFFWFRRSRFVFRSLAPLVSRINEPQTLEATDTHLTVRQRGCTTIMEWTYFIRFVEGPSVFVLFVLPRLGHILPKRAFSEQHLTEFRAFAQAH